MVGKTNEKETGTENSQNGERKSAREEVARARERFLDAAGTFEPLAIVRKHPFLGVGSAFAAGFGTNRVITKLPYLTLLPVGAQILAMTAKLGLLAMNISNKRP